MEFNVDKCKVMHLGHNNPKRQYTMDGKRLAVTEKEKDLGVIIDNKLDFGAHIRSIVGRANRVLGLVKISFAHMDKKMFLNIYTTLIRPLIEYCVQVWSPYKIGYIRLLEGVQRRATKLVPNLKNLPYDERLRKLGLTRLTERRKRGDMIETYKILTGKEKVDSKKFFWPATFRGRSHSKKVYRKYSKLNIRKYYFSQRVVKNWNTLTEEEVNAKKTGEFKRKYDKKEAERIANQMENEYIILHIWINVTHNHIVCGGFLAVFLKMVMQGDGFLRASKPGTVKYCTKVGPYTPIKIQISYIREECS